MEIKIPKEIRRHKETIFFGLSTRQFVCSMLAVGTAVGVYFAAKSWLGKESASWLCLLAAAPVAIGGFFNYNDLTFEQFVWAWFKSLILFARPRVVRADNIYCQAIVREGLKDD